MASTNIANVDGHTIGVANKGGNTPFTSKPLVTGDINPEYSYPVLGLGCLSIAIYTEFPGCIGCASRAMFLTSNWEQMTCKPTRGETSTNSCCITNHTRCECFWPPTFFKFLDQLWCIDLRFGIPCDDDAPLIVNACGYTCCYKNFDNIGEFGHTYRSLDELHYQKYGAPPMKEFTSIPTNPGGAPVAQAIPR